MYLVSIELEKANALDSILEGGLRGNQSWMMWNTHYSSHPEPIFCVGSIGIDLILIIVTIDLFLCKYSMIWKKKQTNRLMIYKLSIYSNVNFNYCYDTWVMLCFGWCGIHITLHLHIQGQVCCEGSIGINFILITITMDLFLCKYLLIKKKQKQVNDL